MFLLFSIVLSYPGILSTWGDHDILEDMALMKNVALKLGLQDLIRFLG